MQTQSNQTYIMILQLDLTTIRLLVQSPGRERDQSHNDQSKDAACDAGVETGPVRRGVLESEDQTSGNTAHTTHTDQCGRAESTLPLTTDVVSLVRHDSWNVAVGSGSGQENT